MVQNQRDTFDIGGDLTVNRLGFGAMRITGDGIIGEPDDVESAKDVLQRAVELGVNFIDTADSYGPGTSERLIREALAPYPEDLVIATKGGLLRNRDTQWKAHGDPDYLRNAHLASLDRLGVDSIDLYQLHRPDPDVDFEDSVTALAELKDDGVVEHVGLSNVSVEQLETARDIVDIATVQNKYSIKQRESADVLQVCEEEGIGFIPWFPLGAGDLGETGEVLDDIASSYSATRYQIALAWLLQHSPVMLPIPGTSSVTHLEENVAASEISLSDDEIARLDG
ncbi:MULTISPECIES: aldo/keto reductase [unclassified Haladaptatus]|uniref:aldo/keto reductase n=1 Tax=unclassified Haladaptatus TaxID=2622732 RepID=UPI0023E803BC|nr:MULTISPECIES: aldo/keto reductase [unclassified Haladaptatus]